VQLLTLPQTAHALGTEPRRVQQHLRDGQLVAVRDDQGRKRVPALFVDRGTIVKHLPSVITQLRDAHFADREIVEWLHRVDDSLPGSPIEALRENRGTEVKRRAQVAGF
jgi:hypothetical protein